jgi:signal transduction histidine kinase/ActR/RegA family two-component response regulator
MQEHLVQFYETDEYLLDSLSSYVRAGVLAGEAAVVVATNPHLNGLEARLLEQGVDIGAAGQTGKYIALDARHTLDQLMDDGVLSPAKFKLLVGSVVSEGIQKGGRLRVFGELVALLCAEGNYEGAIQLEQLWNELAADQKFSLFCGYPLSSFANHVLADEFAHVCATHSRVIPAESYSSLTETDEQRRAILRLQQKAAALESEIAQRAQTEAKLKAAREELEMQVENLRQLHEMTELSLQREQIARSEAEAANRMKDDFLATVSHELRTPLNAIIGWSHMLRSGRLDADSSARAIETIERNAKSQAQLVEDILDVSRVITGKLSLNMGKVDVASTINAAIDSVQLAADSKQIDLRVTLDPSVRQVLGDASRLQQVVWNLLSNAIKFTPAGGRVAVTLERADGNVRLKVNDTGMGITPEFLPYVFDRFRQLDATSTRLHGGLGLGLAIVKHLVELHGGTVAVESPGVGSGSTFTITLPAPVQSPNRKRTKRAAKMTTSSESIQFRSLPSLAGLRVLVVDDDLDSLQLMSVLLEGKQAAVQPAASAQEALQTLEWFEPDVFVFDLAMPGQDGYELITKVRKLESKKWNKAPAIALTAHVRVDDRARALSAGFDLFVPKPVEFEELVLAIANLTEANTSIN